VWILFPNYIHEPDGQRSIAEKHNTAYLETNHAPTGNDLQKGPDQNIYRLLLAQQNPKRNCQQKTTYFPHRFPAQVS